MKQRITVAHGDGIGPEIMSAALEIISATGVQLEIDTIEVGRKVYEQGFSAGIRPEDWETIVRNRVLFKAPITTPQGGGYKSLNVTIRKTLGLFANVRPVKALHPFVPTRHPDMDLVIIRENEEDLYAGIEHRQTQEVVQCLKLISRSGCERIIRYAFEYARHYKRRKVTCMTKDNIMKMTDGLFHRVFDEVKDEYPEIENEHMIIDIGAARLADTPGIFDVVVAPNLYGDIISDIVAQTCGSVGLAGSSNVGAECAMFEAIHGSAPDIAGTGNANPSGLLMAGVMMLNHLGEGEAASLIENAWLKTIEDGVMTADMAKGKSGSVDTLAFTREVILRIGEKPVHLMPAPEYISGKTWDFIPRKATPEKRELTGIDIFIQEAGQMPEEIGRRLESLADPHGLDLDMISNRGIRVYPDGNPLTYCTDHWRCRFMPTENNPADSGMFLALLSGMSQAGVDVIKTEYLFKFDGQPGYSLGQGQ